MSYALLWQPSPPPGRGKARSKAHSHYQSGAVLDESVLVVKAGSNRVRSLLQPIRLTFRHNTKVNTFACFTRGKCESSLFSFQRRVCLMFQIEDAACVFWQEMDLEGRTGEVLCCPSIQTQDATISTPLLCVCVCLQDIGAQRVVIPTLLLRK